MLKRVKKRHKGRQAFTLIELIVVLVILAIIAAVAIPTLIGYINKSKEAKILEAGEDYRVAIQAVASEYYGLHGTAVVGTTDGTKTPNLRWDENPNVPNTAEDRAWGEKVLNLVGTNRDNEPYLLVFGVAKENNQGINPNQVIYIGYLPDLNSPSMFYVNNRWIHEYPKDVGEVKKKNNKNYLVLENGGEVEIQFFVVSNRSNTKNDIWIESAGGENTLQGHSGSGHYGW